MFNIRDAFKQKIRANDREKIQRKALIALKKKKYVFIQKLGSGAYGEVISVKKKIDNKQIAAKIVHKDYASLGELYLWPRLSHPHLISLLDVIKRDEVYIFLTPQHACNLAHALALSMFRQHEDLFEMTIDWMRDIMSGLDCLHASGMYHLDLKSDNILITYDFKAVLSDFSALTETKEAVDGYVLPKYYCPPEAWSSVLGERPKVDAASFDIWAAGMIIFYCFSNRDIERQLWGRKDWMVDVYPLMYNCLQEPFFTELMTKAHPCCKLSAVNCSQALNILRGILRYNANDRPSTKYILDHALLSKGLHSGHLFGEDMVWIRNMREEKIKTRQSNAPILEEFVAKKEKTNFKFPPLDDISENVDIVENVKLHNTDILKDAENVSKSLTSKDQDISKGESVPLETQQQIINIDDNKDSETDSNELKKNSEDCLVPVLMQDDVKNKKKSLANHVSDDSLEKVYVQKDRLEDKILKNILETVAQQMSSKDDNISKYASANFEIKYQTNKTENKFYSEDGDVNRNEAVNLGAQHETTYFANKKDSEMENKMSNKTPEDLPVIVSTHSGGTEEKRNLEHGTSDKLSHENYVRKVPLPNTVYTINDSENSAKELPSNVGDVIQNENLSLGVTHEILPLVNSMESEKGNKILNNIPGDLSVIASTYSNGADRKGNLVYRTSDAEVTDEQTKDRKIYKKKKLSMFRWLQQKFSNFSKTFSRKSH